MRRTPPSGWHGLGLSTAIAAHAGNDDIGRTMQAALADEGVDTHLVRFDPQQPSNRNFVLWFGPDRTILVRPRALRLPLGPPEPT